MIVYVRKSVLKINGRVIIYMNRGGGGGGGGGGDLGLVFF